MTIRVAVVNTVLFSAYCFRTSLEFLGIPTGAQKMTLKELDLYYTLYLYACQSMIGGAGGKIPIRN
jgi:hypothetical protein